MLCRLSTTPRAVLCYSRTCPAGLPGSRAPGVALLGGCTLPVKLLAVKRPATAGTVAASLGSNRWTGAPVARLAPPLSASRLLRAPVELSWTGLAPVVLPGAGTPLLPLLLLRLPPLLLLRCLLVQSLPAEQGADSAELVRTELGPACLKLQTPTPQHVQMPEMALACNPAAARSTSAVAKLCRCNSLCICHLLNQTALAQAGRGDMACWGQRISVCLTMPARRSKVGRSHISTAMP